MRLQTKVISALLPIVLLCVGLLGYWAVERTNEAAWLSSFSHLDAALEGFIRSNIEHRYTLLRDNHLESVPSFVREYQREIEAVARNMPLAEDGHLLVFDGAGRLVFDTDDRDPAALERSWRPVLERLASTGHLPAGHREGPEPDDHELFAADRFPPWDWTVIYAIGHTPIHDAVDDIRRGAAAAALLALALALGATWLIFRRFFVAPVNRLKEAADAIAAGRAGTRIAVDSEDELGVLARHMETMERRLRAGREELLQSEATYRTLVESLPQKVFLKDRDSVYVSCNTRFARDLGVAAAEVAGRTDLDFFPRELAEKYRRDDARVMAAGEVEELEERYHVEGRERWVRTVKAPVRDESGAMVGLLGSFRDITGRKEAEARAARLAEILENTPDFVAMLDLEGRFTWINPAGLALLGYPPDTTVESLDLSAVHPPADRLQLLNEVFPEVRKTGLWSGETTFLARDGRAVPVWKVLIGHRDESGAPPYFSLIGRDLTERKEAEERIRTLNRDLEERVRQRTAELQVTVANLEEEVRERSRVEADLAEERRRLRTLMDNLPGMAFRCANDRAWTMEIASGGSLELTGYRPEDLVGNRTVSYAGLVHPDDRQRVWEEVQAAVADGRPFTLRYRLRTAAGEERQVWEKGRAVPGLTDRVAALEGFVLDVTATERARQELAASEAKFRSLYTAMNEGVALHELLRDAAGVPVDYRLLDVNPAYEAIVGLAREQVVGRPASEIYRSTPPPYLDIYAAVVQSGRPENFETDYAPLAKSFQIRAFSPAPDRFATVFEDITSRKEAERKLAETVADLKRSNRELEQFAYVASHDLQEPLRMVTSYVQLLERRYRGRLDADADDFIGFAVEGATRMQNLINDLLAFSRAGRQEVELTAVDCGQLLADTLRVLARPIEESGATITSEPLPTVRGNRSQLAQVFQNLLGNAVKFRGAEPPRIHVGAERRGEKWLFRVEDNGIGIDPRYFKRLFVIFQRLHGKKDYPGTGIGLALTKKIVERHGGRIWLDSEPGRGTTFYFTLRGAK